MTTHNPKFRGTPGPWRVDGHEHKNGVVEYTIVSISGDAVGCAPVAEVLRNNPRPMPEQRIEANARLLAAAPDLLAVLESLVGIFEPHKLTPYWSMRETVNAAKRSSDTSTEWTSETAQPTNRPQTTPNSSNGCTSDWSALTAKIPIQTICRTLHQ